MKSLIICLSFSLLSLFAFSQSREYPVPIQESKLPKEVVESIKVNFAGAIATECYGVPVSTIEECWFINPNDFLNRSDFDHFFIVVKKEEGTLYATIARNGELINEQENFKNDLLSKAIKKHILTNYPLWKMNDEHTIMTYHNGGQNKIIYKVYLSKDKEKMFALFDANGKFMKTVNKFYDTGHM